MKIRWIAGLLALLLLPFPALAQEGTSTSGAVTTTEAAPTSPPQGQDTTGEIMFSDENQEATAGPAQDPEATQLPSVQEIRDAERPLPDLRFNVAAILPGNTLEADVGYFYLHMEPGQEQTLQVAVNNEGALDIVVYVEAGTAYSSTIGGLVYGEVTDPDPSLAVNIVDLIEIEEPVLRIPAQSTAFATVQLTMPEEPFEGELLGALNFTYLPVWRQLELGLLDPEEEMDEAQTAIRSLYTYQVQVRLREDLTPVVPEVELQHITATQTVGTQLVFTLRNPSPAILLRGKMILTVTDQGGDVVFYYENNETTFAPNSVMPLTLLTEEPLPAGTYNGQVIYRFLEYTWELDASFEVGA